MTIINLNATIKSRDFGETVNEKMWSLSVFKGDIIDVVTVDGPSDDYKCEVHLTNWFTGRTYALDCVFIGRVENWSDEETGQDWDTYVSSEYRADRMIEKIKEKGSIDLSYWVDITEAA